MIYELYARYGGDYKTEAGSVEEAIGSLTHGNDYGECFPIGVFGAEANELYIPDTEPADVHDSSYRLDFVRKVCELLKDHAFSAIHQRSFHGDYGFDDDEEDE